MTKTLPTPTPPDHLSPATAAWWLTVLRDFELEPSHVVLLTLACEALDRCRQATEILARDGLTCEASDGGIKAHPAVSIERDSRLAFARLLRQLDLKGGPAVPAPGAA